MRFYSIKIGLCILGLWTLGSCYAMEMHMEDPIYSFKEERRKNFLFLPFHDQSANHLKTTEHLAHLSEQTFTDACAQLPAIQVLKPVTLSDIFLDSGEIEPNLMRQQIQQKSKNTDVLVAGSVRYTVHLGTPNNGKLITTQDEDSLNLAQKNKSIYLEVELAVTFWDAVEGKVIFQQIEKAGDIALLSERHQLEESVVRLAVQQLIHHLQPYYTYG